MALVVGTNCGFVTVAPTNDPGGTVYTMDAKTKAIKDTVPAGATTITEIGWWSDTATEEANYEVGIYSHDAGNNRPSALLGSAKINAKGTGAGWKSVTGLNIEITAEFTYWIAVQLDDTATTTSTNFQGGMTGEYFNNEIATTTLPDPTWGAYASIANVYLAFYAVYEVIPEGLNPKVKVSGTFATKKTLVKIGGTFAEKPVMVKVDGTFQ